jgi:hypothetical protein
MKWAFVIEQKLKAGMLLAGIMLSIILVDLLEKQNIREIKDSVTSIYDDRLVPATDLFFISEKLYRKHFLLERFFNDSKGNLKKVQAELRQHDRDIAGLISKFEKTRLVKEESKSLKAAKSKIDNYKLLEARVIEVAGATTKAAGQKVFERDGRPALEKATQQLSNLTTIQTTEGSALLKSSEISISSSDNLRSLHIALAIIVGIIILILVGSSNTLMIRQNRFNLN